MNRNAPSEIPALVSTFWEQSLSEIPYTRVCIRPILLFPICSHVCTPCDTLPATGIIILAKPKVYSWVAPEQRVRIRTAARPAVAVKIFLSTHTALATCKPSWHGLAILPSNLGFATSEKGFNSSAVLICPDFRPTGLKPSSIVAPFALFLFSLLFLSFLLLYHISLDYFVPL